MYLLSTSILADMLSRDQDRAVFEWLRRTRPAGDELFVSVISFGIVASSVEDLLKQERGEWRRLLQEGRRQFVEQGTIIDVDLPIVDTWSAALRGADLVESSADTDVEVGDEERLVIATAITRSFTLVAPPRPYLELLCDCTTLTVTSP